MTLFLLVKTIPRRKPLSQVIMKVTGNPLTIVVIVTPILILILILVATPILLSTSTIKCSKKYYVERKLAMFNAVGLTRIRSCGIMTIRLAIVLGLPHRFFCSHRFFSSGRAKSSMCLCLLIDAIFGTASCWNSMHDDFNLAR